MEKEKVITCDFKDCNSPAVVLISNENRCFNHQYAN